MLDPVLRGFVETESEDDMPTVSGDRVQLQQVIMNLVLNAADAMRQVSDRPRQLLVRTSREPHEPATCGGSRSRMPAPIGPLRCVVPSTSRTACTG